MNSFFVDKHITCSPVDLHTWALGDFEQATMSFFNLKETWIPEFFDLISDEKQNVLRNVNDAAKNNGLLFNGWESCSLYSIVQGMQRSKDLRLKINITRAFSQLHSYIVLDIDTIYGRAKGKPVAGATFGIIN